LNAGRGIESKDSPEIALRWAIRGRRKHLPSVIEECRVVKRRLLVAIGLAVSALTIITLGYLSWNVSVRTDRAQLPRYGLAPEFELKDQDGIEIGDRRLRGRTWVADFFDSANPGPAALLASQFAELDQNFQKGNQLTLVSFVIPKSEQDKPDLVNLARRYLASSHWRFVTSNADEAARLQGLFPKIDSVGTKPGSFYLIDAEGTIRGVYDGRSPEVVQRLLGDIGTLLRTGSK
jgi:peroxiredoxin